MGLVHSAPHPPPTHTPFPIHAKARKARKTTNRTEGRVDRIALLARPRLHQRLPGLEGHARAGQIPLCMAWRSCWEGRGVG